MLKDSLIRDRIVVGVLDDSLSDQLQSKASLTLVQAVQMSRQAESRAQNRDLVRGDNKPASVKFINSEKSGNKKLPNKETPKPAQSCEWCGYKRHQRQVCPAKDATCNKCKKRGLFENVCRNPASQQRKYTSSKMMTSRKREMRFYFLEKFKPQGAVGPPNSGLMATVLASSWIPVPQSQSLVHIPRG